MTSEKDQRVYRLFIFLGKLNDRQRCGYVAITKYDLPPDLDDPTGGKGEKPKLETVEEKKAKN